jgi:pre-mRNA-splicing factor SYF1
LVFNKKILNDDGYNSMSGKTNYEFLKLLCEIIQMHPHDIVSIDCAPIMFFGIKKYTDEIGSLWIGLADYYIKLG